MTPGPSRPILDSLTALTQSSRLAKGAWRIARTLDFESRWANDADAIMRRTKHIAAASYLTPARHRLACRIALEVPEHVLAQLVSEHSSKPYVSEQD